MQAARRLYLYAMSGITLGVIAFGLVLLLRVLFDGFFPDPFDDGYGSYDSSPEQLSQAIAMLGVGVPVWAVHWWLVQRGLRQGRPERDEERGSMLRAIYLTGILFISLFVWVTSAASVLQWFATDLLKIVPEYTFQDPLGAATGGVTAFAIWLYHGLVRRGDLAAGPVSGPAAWVPRLYLYGVSIVSGYVALTVVGTIVNSVIWGSDLGLEKDYAAFSLTQQVIAAMAFAVVWLGHWTYANRLMRDEGWRGTEERVSRTRVGAFVTIVVVAAASTLIGLVGALNVVLGMILPREPGLNFDGVPNVEFEASAVAAALVTAGLWAAVWWTHNRALKREPAAADPLRALHQERLAGHGVAAAALAIGATGAGWLLGYLIDLVLGKQVSIGNSSWQLAEFVALALVGLVAWAWFWRPIVARRRVDPSGEANSTIRRTFLYLTIGVALVVAIATAAVILYRFVGLVVGTGSGGSLASELAAPLGGLIAAAAVLAYHGLALRGDQRLHPAVATAAPESVAPAEAGSVEPGVPGPGAPEQRRSLSLTGPADADLDGALAAARAALPPGIELVASEE
jgi:hypothetical protein